MRTVRPPAVAGQFYPEDPVTLQETVNQYLAGAAVDAELPARLIGCVVPHAGYMYSGATAAFAYRALADNPVRTVVLIGPSHRDYFGAVSVYSGDAYSTPLGLMNVNTALARQIAEYSDGIMLSDLGHRMEHALEVQVPFLQTVLPDASIVPIVMGVQDRDSCQGLAAGLAEVLAHEDAVLIASSDLSHFHQYDTARTIDGDSAFLISSFDAEGFLQALDTHRIEACGGGPIATVMLASRALGAMEAKVLHTCNSGDISGDRSSVVGYLAAVFGRAAA